MSDFVYVHFFDDRMKYLKTLWDLATFTFVYFHFANIFYNNAIYRNENAPSENSQPHFEIECLTVSTHVAFKPHPTTSSQMQLERSLRKQNAK